MPLDLRSAREHAGLGLREAAKMLKLSPTYLSRVETHKERTPSAKRLEQIATLYKVDVVALIMSYGHLPPRLVTWLKKNPERVRVLMGEIDDD